MNKFCTNCVFYGRTTPCHVCTNASKWEARFPNILKGENNMNNLIRTLANNNNADLVVDGRGYPIMIETIDHAIGEPIRFSGRMLTPVENYVRNDILAAKATAMQRIEQIANRPRMPEIKKVHCSGPVTAVIWADGTKTVVRCTNEDIDYEKGLAMAIAKKAFGTNETGSNYYEVFRKFLPKPEAGE